MRSSGSASAAWLPVLLIAVMFVLATARPPRIAAQGAGFSIAIYNISGGKGVAPVGTRDCPFTESMNCTDPAKPMNAWGHGIIQQELQRVITAHPQIAGMVLDESYQGLCASPTQVQKALGWKEHVPENNGLTALARYGIAGKPEWLQLDTKRNDNPYDTMWVIHLRLCLDDHCRATLPVYAAHWYATGDYRTETFERQAEETIAFMADRSKNEPHLLVGDLNVWEGQATCQQTPVPSAVQKLRAAGYVDAWTAAHGTAEGSTGMFNRSHCGEATGYLWKRIDYVWAKNMPAPRAVERFGLPAKPGDCAPSDHAGVVVDYPMP